MTGKRTKHEHVNQSEGDRMNGPEVPAAVKSESQAGAAEVGATATDNGKLDALKAQLEDVNSRYVRLAADFENFKKRARQERIELIEHANARLAEQLLPVVDDFDRVLEHVPEGLDETWLKGVRMTVEKLHEVLKAAGVEPIEAVGVRFDPKLHEAIATEESDDHPEDTVLGQVRRGYRMHDRVLRPAMVRITRSSSPGS
jgi:molecular chaperone GrpE